MKLWWHKVRHWEYWPVYIVYLPTFFLWFVFVIRFRSTKFYYKSNPAFENGGMHDDSKMHIYSLLPKKLYPKSFLVNEKIEPSHLANHLAELELSFPLIVKPDIGERGVGVKKVFSLNELFDYEKQTDKPFLVQEICNYTNEMGLFYCRMPNELNGKITGITLKKFLTVTGNGQDSIKTLLQKVPRFAMQIPKLQNQIKLNEILKPNEERCVVPFGNHNRGTEFLDGKALITEKLTATMDAILNKIDGFYYGRLDIRYNTFEELEKGEKFSIIEINGAKSEPTHIYDPKHSFWYGQKEIFRHQFIFAKIIARA